MTAALLEIETNSKLQHAEKKQVVVTPNLTKPLRKKLIYLLLIVLLTSLGLNLYLFFDKKQEDRKTEKIIRKHIPKVNAKTADATKTITPDKK